MMQSTSISTETIRDVNRLREFEPEWRGFLQRCSAPTPFQTPEWLLPWWTHFGSGVLHVLAFRCRGNVVGILPGFLHDWNSRRQLTLIGSGVSDYLDPVLDPAHTTEIMASLEDHLAGCSDWDVCDWQDLSAGTPLAFLGNAAGDAPCTEVPMSLSWERFLASRPAELRRNLRVNRRKEEALGTVQFAASAASNHVLVEALIGLHTACWRARGLPGMIEQNGAGPFLRAVAGSLASRDMLRFFTICVDGKIVAIILALRNYSSLFGYLSGFDPVYAKYSFGQELIAQALRYAHDNRYRSWNFLRGVEAYKFEWGAVELPKVRVRRRRSE
jgi:CelD/BcsL family acetyltransferase involved in cellulose biosynthesis